jgi:hypothetical protein
MINKNKKRPLAIMITFQCLVVVAGFIVFALVLMV